MRKNDSHLTNASGVLPTLSCSCSGISRKWLCLFLMTLSKSRKLPELYFLYFPKLARNSASSFDVQLLPPMASSAQASRERSRDLST